MLPSNKSKDGEYYTTMCWEAPGALDALETLDSSCSISSCPYNQKNDKILYTYILWSKTQMTNDSR